MIDEGLKTDSTTFLNNNNTKRSIEATLRDQLSSKGLLETLEIILGSSCFEKTLIGYVSYPPIKTVNTKQYNLPRK